MAPQSLSIIDDDDDDDDDDDELSLWNGRPTKGIKPYFQPGCCKHATRCMHDLNLRGALIYVSLNEVVQ